MTRGTGVALAALLLAACAQTELAIHTAKQIRERTTETTPRVGDYKVGSPYQINGTWYYPKEDFAYSETGVASWYGPQFHGKSTANGEIFDMNQLTAAHKTLQMPAVVRVTNLENGRSILLRVNDRGPFARNRIIDVSRRGAQLLGFLEKGTALVRVELMAEESRMAALAARRKEAVAALPRTEPLSARPQPAGEAPADDGEAASPPRPASARIVAAPVQPKPVPSVKPPLPVATQIGGQAGEPVQIARASLAGEVRQVAVKGEPQMYIQVGAFRDRSNADRLRSRLSGLGPAEVSPTEVSGQRFYRVRVGPVRSVVQADRMLDAVLDAGHANAQVVVD